MINVASPSTMTTDSHDEQVCGSEAAVSDGSNQTPGQPPAGSVGGGRRRRCARRGRRRPDRARVRAGRGGRCQSTTGSAADTTRARSSDPSRSSGCTAERLHTRRCRRAVSGLRNDGSTPATCRPRPGRYAPTTPRSCSRPMWNSVSVLLSDDQGQTRGRRRLATDALRIPADWCSCRACAAGCRSNGRN